MVKQAERKVKRNPLLPIFGIIVAAGLFAVALFVSNAMIDGDLLKVQQLMSFDKSPNRNVALVGVAFGIWLALLAFAYFIVALLAGKDPDDARQIKLPPREKKKQYRK